MHPSRSIFAILLLCFGCNAPSQAPTEAPSGTTSEALADEVPLNETVTGEELYVVCAFCHGDSFAGE